MQEGVYSDGQTLSKEAFVNTKNVKIFFIFFLCFLLFSCIDIDTEIIFKQNLTGEVLIRYSVSKAAINMGKIDRHDNFLPLPIEEQRYHELAANIDGLKLISFRKQETENDINITVRYEFRNIEALNAIVSNSNDKKIEVQKRGERTYYTQRISANNQAISEETIKLAQAIFGNRTVSFKVTAPQNISTVNSGTIAGRSAQVSYNLPQLLSSTDNVTWEVSW